MKKLTTSDFITPLFFQFFEEKDRDYVADIWTLLSTIFENRMMNITYEDLSLLAKKHNPEHLGRLTLDEIKSLHAFTLVQILDAYHFLQDEIHMFNSMEKVSWDTFASLLCIHVKELDKSQIMYIFHSLYQGKSFTDSFTARMLWDISSHPTWRKMRENI
jgi:serine/threonine protein kinase